MEEKKLKIRALASASGDTFTVSKGGEYVLPEKIALDLVRGGLAKLIENRESAVHKAATYRETGVKR